MPSFQYHPVDQEAFVHKSVKYPQLGTADNYSSNVHGYYNPVSASDGIVQNTQLQQQISFNLYISLLSDLITFKTTNTFNSPFPSDSWPRSPLPLLRDFVIQLVMLSQSLPITLLVVIVLLDRLRISLPNHAVGTNETGHRVFLAAIIVANKFLLDVPVKNSVWSQWTNNYYSISEINCMECQFLNLLHHDIEVSMSEVQSQLAIIQRNHLLTPSPRGMPVMNSTRHIGYGRFIPMLSLDYSHSFVSNDSDAFTNGPRKRNHSIQNANSGSHFQVTVPPISEKNSFPTKKQKHFFFDQTFNWHSIPSPSPSLDRSPNGVAYYPSSSHPTLGIASRTPCSRQMSFV